MEMSRTDKSIPKGTAEERDPKYPVNSSVVALVGHMPGQRGKSAKVLKAVTGTFYVVDFGDGPHKWYAEGELVKDR